MNEGNAIIIAATVLGLSIVAGSSLLVRSVDSVGQELAAAAEAISELQQAAAPSRPAAAPPRRQRGPDPDKVYEVNTAGSPARGAEDAEVTLVEFSDFQCPFCGRVTATLKQVEAAYGDRVRIVFKHLPLRMHDKAPKAHAAAEAAKAQGKFWEMHDRIFSNQRELSEEKFLEYAGEIGLDVERFRRDMASPQIKARVDRDAREAASLGVTGTPGFFVNGRFMAGAKPFDDFKRMIDAQLDEG